MTDLQGPRLIEVAFPLRQTSIDSVHEKNVRHGHISTLHIWPARRPLAACRAALIATLLPDPGTPEERRQLIERLGGRTVKVTKRKKMPNGKTEETEVEETVGGILHWGRESSPDLEWFRQKIREAYGGTPKVLDPFAGGGAIPLEAMRLGCEVTASDLNPVAWFILKCTLEYPQKLAGQYRPLPTFALESPEFMEGYFKGTGKLTKKQLERNLETVQLGLFPPPDVDLSWHVRAWGWWVLQRAKQDLAKFYSTYAERLLRCEEDTEDYKRGNTKIDRVLCPLKADGSVDRDALNDFSTPQSFSAASAWTIKPTVAYLWARTVQCKNCRATIPLLKTRWLCKKENKRVLLKMEPNAEKTGVIFSIESDVPKVGKNTAQRREHDKKIGAGTMSKSGVVCPCCAPTIMKMDDIRLEGRDRNFGTVMTAVIVDGKNGKEYRSPTAEEIETASAVEQELEQVFSKLPFGLPEEPTPAPAGSKQNSSSLRIYGLTQWQDVFTPRQLLSLGNFIKNTRFAYQEISREGYSADWIEAITAYLYDSIARLADRNSELCTWQMGAEKIGHSFTRFALPITWDFVEVMPWADSSGGFLQAVDWVAQVIDHLIAATNSSPVPNVVLTSAILSHETNYDLIITDPPYYDAISYSDLMDFFYIWLRRTLHGLFPKLTEAVREPLAPKWNHEKNDGELVDNPTHFGGDKEKSKNVYEDGMFRAFQACYKSLTPEGRLVIVFANKSPDAWETLVSATIRAGFVVDGSWPIQTERLARTRSISSAALSSSVWLVCKKRPTSTRPGWDNKVLEEMHNKVRTQLREFWDAGIRGPDFVWAATGPALEAYSQYPVVKKANEPGQVMKVSEFLDHVRRMVVNFVVGRILPEGDPETASGLDDITAYYLLHRRTFGMEETPIGACILYALSCGLKDRELVDLELISRSGSAATVEAAEYDDETEDDDSAETIKGSTVKLKPWNQRFRRSLGYEAPGGKPVPLIDQAHRLIHLWKSGDKSKVDEYLKGRGLHHNVLFYQLLQSLIELSAIGSEEKSILESISNDITPKATTAVREQLSIYLPVDEDTNAVNTDNGGNDE